MNLLNSRRKMYLKIQNIVKTLNFPKPKIITNPDSPDNLIEKDLQGLDLSDIVDKNIIRLLSSDLTTFNDYAFRYYTPYFISYYLISYEYIFLNMFVPAYKKTDNLLTENSIRFLQFQEEEVKTIISFFRYLLDEIELLNKQLQCVDFNSAVVKLNNSSLEDKKLEFHYLDLLDCKEDIESVLNFWKKHSANIK